MRCNTATVVSAVVILLGTAADSAKHNVPGQARTRTCVAMKGEKVPLRYADGTLTGWFVRGDDPSMQGGNQKDCPPGSMEMDAHEIITTANGMKLYFHPGGGPDHYKNWIDNGQYGHIAAGDMKALPPIKPSANGKPAPLHEGARYIITPTRIPQDMFYKPNADEHGHTGSTYLTYGNPGFEKTGGRDEWTYINWSWVQNGAAEYPANKCGGGGIVRAMGKSGTIFTAAAVEPIIGYSYGKDNKINGRVTAFYGRSFAGPGEKGMEIFGWMPHSYQKNGDMIVPCIRRQLSSKGHDLKPTAIDSKNPMERMAARLLFTIDVDAAQADKLRDEWAKKFEANQDRLARMELLTEMSQLDDAATIALMKRLTRPAGMDQRVYEQARELIAFMASREPDITDERIEKGIPWKAGLPQPRKD